MDFHEFLHLLSDMFNLLIEIEIIGQVTWIARLPIL